jgi:hypothetical protein
MAGLSLSVAQDQSRKTDLIAYVEQFSTVSTALNRLFYFRRVTFKGTKKRRTKDSLNPATSRHGFTLL